VKQIDLLEKDFSLGALRKNKLLNNIQMSQLLASVIAKT
jgi:hypothetical protein